MMTIPSNVQSALKAIRRNEPRTLSASEITFLFVCGYIFITNLCTITLTRDGEDLADTLIANEAADIEVYA